MVGSAAAGRAGLGRNAALRTPLLAGLLWLVGCQSVLGFEDFSEAGSPRGGTAGSGSKKSAGGNGEAAAGAPGAGGLGRGGEGLTPSGAGRGALQGEGGAAAAGARSDELEAGKQGQAEAGSSGQAAPGEGGASALGFAGAAGTLGSRAAGDPCGRTQDCLADLVCVFGRCRAACATGGDCEGSKHCFTDDGVSGCRLAAEGACDAVCVNGQLVCGLDATCRAPCDAAHPCGIDTQRCVAGACVSTVGDEGRLFDCGGLDDGALTCNGAELQACNVLVPGLSPVEECASAALCSASLTEASFDPAAPPICLEGCESGERFCEGAALRECDQAGVGPVGAGQECETPELCALALSSGASSCPEPICETGETRCSGGATALEGQACSEGRTGFEVNEVCEGAQRCNPSTGRCTAFEVDATEVSRADYAAWLDSEPDFGDQAPGCLWNDSFEPDAACMALAACAAAGDQGSCPVVCVDWCDASAYCAAQGRRLCGRLGGGMVPLDEFAEPSISEWMNACSAAGQFVYAHGNTVPETEPGACVYRGNAGGSAYPVGSRADCHSPAAGYSSLYDMSGNVAEWENSCEVSATGADASPQDACRTRGGSYESGEGELRCGTVPAILLERSATEPTVGFRCCGG